MISRLPFVCYVDASAGALDRGIRLMTRDNA